MPKILVLNNRESLIIGQLPHTKDAGGVPMAGRIVQIIPGINLVDKGDFEHLRANKAFAQLFTAVIGQSKAPEYNSERIGACILVAGEELPDAKPFAKVPAQRCAEIARECFSVPFLEEWLANEARDEVRLNLQRQLTILRKGVSDNPQAANIASSTGS